MASQPLALPPLLFSGTTPATFYVDSAVGDDAAAGTSPAAAWRSLEQVNQADLIPGDRVLLKRGGLWRGQLVPHSGASASRSPTARMAKVRSRSSRSIDRSRPGNLGRASLDLGNPAGDAGEQEVMTVKGANWTASFQGSRKGPFDVSSKSGESFVRVTCEHRQGRAANDSARKLTPSAPYLVLHMRARCNKPFRFDSVNGTLPAIRPVPGTQPAAVRLTA